MDKLGKIEEINITTTLRNLTSAELLRKWPKLRFGNHTVTSQATRRYNCVAFAANDERHWWEHGVYGGGIHWPGGIADTLDGWMEVFIGAGFKVTDNRDVEPGIEKVAIYVSLEDMRPGHVAISDGRRSEERRVGKE